MKKKIKFIRKFLRLLKNSKGQIELILIQNLHINSSGKSDHSNLSYNCLSRPTGNEFGRLQLFLLYTMGSFS